jgi:hypothetical protein
MTLREGGRFDDEIIPSDAGEPAREEVDVEGENAEAMYPGPIPGEIPPSPGTLRREEKKEINRRILENKEVIKKLPTKFRDLIKWFETKGEELEDK